LFFVFSKTNETCSFIIKKYKATST
jgi:hypothetical protein